MRIHLLALAGAITSAACGDSTSTNPASDSTADAATEVEVQPDIVAETSEPEVVADTAPIDTTEPLDTVDTIDAVDSSDGAEAIVSGAFACIAAPTPFARSESASVTLRVRLVDPATASAWAGASVKACHRDDATCAVALGEATTVADGLVTLVLPAGRRGFDGYLEITGSGLQSTLAHIDPPLRVDAASAVDLAVPARDALAAAAAAAGVTFDPELAHARAVMLDCDGLPAEAVGIFFEGGFIGGVTKTWYADAPSGVLATQAGGLAGGFNLMAGSTVVNGNVRALTKGRYGRLHMFLRAGWLSIGTVHPSQVLPDFSCDGVFTLPATGPSMITYKLLDALNSEALPDVTVDLCTDADCHAPLESVTSDAGGSVVIPLPQPPGGFVGYLALQGGGVYPGRVDLRPPLTLLLEENVAEGLPLVTASAAQAFAFLADAPLDPARGHVVLGLSDCRSDPGAGLIIEVASTDASSKVVYLNGLVPDTTLVATSDNGQVAVLNLPVGATTIIGKDSAGHPFGSLALEVRAGNVVYGRLVPTP